MSAPHRPAPRPNRRRPIPAPPEPPALPVPTGWARARIAAARAAGPLPAYGGPDWEALPDEDPRKTAAAIAAAEARRYETATLAEQLRRELAGTAETVADLELTDAVAAGAAAAQQRAARADRLAAASIASTLARLGTPAFAESTPVRDAPGWPRVRQPGTAD